MRLAPELVGADARIPWVAPIGQQTAHARTSLQDKLFRWLTAMSEPATPQPAEQSVLATTVSNRSSTPAC